MAYASFVVSIHQKVWLPDRGPGSIGLFNGCDQEGLVVDLPALTAHPVYQTSQIALFTQLRGTKHRSQAAVSHPDSITTLSHTPDSLGNSRIVEIYLSRYEPRRRTPAGHLAGRSNGHGKVYKTLGLLDVCSGPQQTQYILIVTAARKNLSRNDGAKAA